ncbi:MAG: alpha/beta hydrolase [Clostridia bacterium]|nr:alpha/beta hydrolase [Clostridia bacterium]
MIIKIKGYNINYEVEGDGTPVILLHGWLANLETMKVLQKHLSKNFKVFNVDIIGFGKSDLPKEPMSSNDYGDFLNNFIEELKIENPILIGHSNGGRTIINYAGRNLGKIRKIILIDSAGLKPKRPVKYYIKVYTFKLLKNIFRILPKTEMLSDIRENILGKFGSSDYKSSPEVLRKTMNIILNEDVTELLSNIKASTLLIWGEKDTATPIEDGKKMEKLIPDAGLVEVKNAGHFSYLDNLNLCLAVIDEFLKNDIQK